jgi:hypothetical protein
MRHGCVVSLFLAILVARGGLFSQTSWYVDPKNPHLRSHRILDPSVLYDSTRSIYELWASDGYYVVRGVSLDGRDWFDYENNYGTVLTAAFGIEFLHGVEVVHVDSIYYMYYTAHDLNDNIWIGLAISSDGFTWTSKNGGPVISLGEAGSWESKDVWYPKVVVVGGIFYMLYGGHAASGGAIGLATSADGISWKKFSGNPVLIHGTGSDPDANGVNPAGFTYKDGIFYLMFGGEASTGKLTLSLATSTDCLVWSKHQGNPVLGPGEPLSWDGYVRAGGALRYAKGAWHYWYSGTASSGSSYYQMGYASSSPLLLSTGPGMPGIPGKVELHQNYPNPFNPSTTIRFQLPRASHVTLTVYDVLGREVSVLVNEGKDAGVHEVKFDGSNLASGVYFNRLQAGEFVQIRKLVLLR